MGDTIKFPNGGYDVRIVRKQDILDCLDKNVTDKEVILEIIEQFEIDASNFINQGRWTGLPFVGNVRVPPKIKAEQQEEQQELIQVAKETLDKQKYYMFRKQLGIDNHLKNKQETLYRYILSKMIKKNNKTYKKLVVKKGELWARLHSYFSYALTPFGIEINFDYGEE